MLSRALVLTACVLFACNSVLGIDEARLDSQGSSGTSGLPATGTVVPTATCVSTTRCASCMQSCAATDLTACLADGSCRAALDDYRGCMTRKKCTDSDPANNPQSCAEALHSAGTNARALSDCLAGSCATDCAGSLPASICQYYCACMAQNCSISGSVDDCLNTCNALDPSVAYCRWDHCEFAPHDPTLHCDHAVGLRGQCVSPLGPSCTADLIISGLICSDDAQCCSGACDNNICD